MQDKHWNRLVNQLNSGECTPFIGSGACWGTLPVGAQLANTYADLYRYPFRDRDDLARVMQYAAFEEGDAVDLKKRVARELAVARAPDFTERTQPHGVLAQFPLPLYITTNYDNLMSDALIAYGRAPQTVICPWDRRDRDEPWSSPPADPNRDKPVVFHLHGAASRPASMVLTQDDYLTFLLALAIDKGFDKKSIIPTNIGPLLTLRPLLFVGYSLKDWSFQVLFRGLEQLTLLGNKRRDISVQLVDPLFDTDPATDQRAKAFLDDYFEQRKITVFWGTAAEFCSELSARRTGGGHVA